jgi:hypothetical protein
LNALVTDNSLRPLCALHADVTLITLGSGNTLISGNALMALCALIALGTLDADVALDTLMALCPLIALRSTGVARLAFVALNALLPLGAHVILIN